MEIITKYLKKLYQFLKIHKSKWFIFILFSLVFFLIRFPYEEAVLYLINQLQKNTKSSIQLKYDNFYINPLGPSLVFNNPRILTPVNQSTFTAQQLSIRPSYKSLLQLKPGVVITLKQLDSMLNITIRKKQAEKDKSGWFTHIKTHNFTPSSLSSFSSVLSKIRGKINIDIEILIDPTFEIQPVGSWSINGENIHSQVFSYTFPGDVGTVSLPDFKWSRINSIGHIKKGQFTISDISLGEKKDAFQIKSRGIVSVNFTKQGFSKRVTPHFKSYNIGLNVLINEDLMPKLYDLNIFLSYIDKFKTTTPQGRRYLTHIKGNSANFFDPSSISKLPTLQEIQNPEDDEIF